MSGHEAELKSRTYVLTSRTVMVMEAGTLVNIDPTDTPSVIIGLDLAAVEGLLESEVLAISPRSVPDQRVSGGRAWRRRASSAPPRHDAQALQLLP